MADLKPDENEKVPNMEAADTDSEEDDGVATTGNDEVACDDKVMLVGLGRCEGMVYKLGKGEEIVLGRNDFDEKKLSGKHCKVTVDEKGKVAVADLSKNGTFVNKKSIAKGASVELDNGDSITLLHPDKKSGNLEFLVKKPYTAGVKRKRADSTTTPSKKPSFDTANLEESLTCGICQEILYKPVSCIPCLHNFCSPCYSEWMGVNSKGECPLCRSSVTELRKNHSLQSAAEALMASKPSLKRTESQIAELEKRNKITDESLRITKKAGHQHHSENDSESWSEGEEDEELDDYVLDDGDFAIAGPLIPGGFSLANVNFGMAFASQVDHCNECDAPGKDGHQCPPTMKNHLRCTSCNQNFPNRPEKTQRCDVCRKPFCNEYWGCPGPNNGGSFKPLKDQAFPTIPQPYTFAGNPFEISILTTWMSEQSRTPQSLWEECLNKLNNKEWSPHGIICNTPNIKSDNFSCGQCAAKIFGGLLYHLRRSIPKEELNDGVNARSDCWYGLECRTQHNKPAHAANLNHVCPKTRG
eukprot:TRINITY_DN5575_c0_g1_i1.p1 TRINITY_DN5575_c0_g1~~TRINITY_DN5575_c0_g1_i1.p1  ORF type:complete len:527 (+),score=100.91 TRINITY_DN5575_c0_g1_i1:112-1692(+)